MIYLRKKKRTRNIEFVKEVTWKRKIRKKVWEKERRREKEINNNEEVGWLEWIDKTSFALRAKRSI